jgi:hypothetical protein
LIDRSFTALCLIISSAAADLAKCNDFGFGILDLRFFSFQVGVDAEGASS